MFRASTGEPDERIDVNTKCLFGFNSGAIGSAAGMDPEQLQFASAVLATKSRVHRLLRGEIRNETIPLDGKALMNARLTRCHLIIETGDFASQNTTFDECQFEFRGLASQIYQLIKDGTSSGGMELR